MAIKSKMLTMAFLFTLPVVLYCNVKIQALSPDLPLAFQAGYLAGIAGLATSVVIGVMVSSFLLTHYINAKRQSFIIIGFFSSLIWLALYFVGLESFMSIKFHTLFPVYVSKSVLLKIAIELGSYSGLFWVLGTWVSTFKRVPR